jgi:hypothetical protein
MGRTDQSTTEGHTVRIYDVYYAPSAAAGKDLQTTLCITHEDQKTWWEDSREWKSFYCSEDEKRQIEEAIERSPHVEQFSVGLCIVRRRCP